jgi:F0F1-type ATP synthase delta subunit
MNSSFPLPREWVKTAALRALKEGGSSIIEDIAKELSPESITELIKVLEKVRKTKVSPTIEVKGVR